MLFQREMDWLIDLGVSTVFHPLTSVVATFENLIVSLATLASLLFGIKRNGLEITKQV